MGLVARKPKVVAFYNKGADQPERTRSLISDFVVQSLESIIVLLYTQNFSILANICNCAGWFEACMVENPEDRFSHVETHLSKPW